MISPADDEVFDVQQVDASHFRISGALDFASVPAVLKETARVLPGTVETIVDLAGVERADSAGLALLMEWLRRARQAGVALHYVNLPVQLRAIARVAGVEKMLAAD